MAKRYYLVDYTALVGGVVRVKASSKDEAFRAAQESAASVDEQIEGDLRDVKPFDFDVKFDRRSVVLDTCQEDEDTGPGSDEEEEE